MKSMASVAWLCGKQNMFSSLSLSIVVTAINEKQRIAGGGNGVMASYREK